MSKNTDLDHIHDFSFIMNTILQPNCGEFLNAMKEANHIPMRGLKNVETPNFFLSGSPANRESVDTPRIIDQSVNDSLAKAGFIALRSNSVFISTNISEVMRYAGNKSLNNVFFVIPTNGCSFTWSTEVIDLFDAYNEFEEKQTNTDAYYDMVTNSADGYTDIKKFKDAFHNSIKDEFIEIFNSTYLPTYSSKNFTNALKSKNEIMVNGKYYSLRYSTFQVELYDWLGL